MTESKMKNNIQSEHTIVLITYGLSGSHLVLKSECVYENLNVMSNNYRRTAVQKKVGIVN